MNEPTRRTMNAALQTPELSPKALAFIKEGTPQSEVTRSALTPAPQSAIKSPAKIEMEKADCPSSAPAPESQISAVQKTKVSREPNPAAPEFGNLASLTFRVPRDIPPGLVRASADRKINRLRPFTQQEIVAEAVAVWLKKNGYLS